LNPCARQDVPNSVAYCGSGYVKRRKYIVHGEWNWSKFQSFLTGSKLRSQKNDFFRNLMMPQHVKDLQVQLGTYNVKHVTTLDWLILKLRKRKTEKAPSKVLASKASSSKLRRPGKGYSPRRSGRLSRD